MGKKARLKIGLIFHYDENWIGGSYYIINIIKSLNFLPDNQKPLLQIIFSSEKEYDIINKLNYPYLEFINSNSNLPFWKRAFNFISIKIINKNIFNPFYKLKKVRNIFPCTLNEKYLPIKNKIFWIPDFQERYLQHFFDEDEIYSRNNTNTLISKQKHVVFSSKSALNDFNSFYPDSTINKYVFNFSSILPSLNQIDVKEIFNKYKLKNELYFFSPNQFWEHKNHIIILRALKRLKDDNKLDFQVYFSGKEFDHRNPNYFDSLKSFVINNKLETNVFFLGFIDRIDQLFLMKHAKAIIQPSLFEGWSTVIEDSKALNKNIIVSDLPVHKEQLADRAYYFNPYDENELITQIEKVKLIDNSNFEFDYIDEVKKNAINFVTIFEKINSLG